MRDEAEPIARATYDGRPPFSKKLERVGKKRGRARCKRASDEGRLTGVWYYATGDERQSVGPRSVRRQSRRSV